MKEQKKPLFTDIKPKTNPHKVDKRMFFCTLCERCYEWQSVGGGSFIYYEKGAIPTYGKARQTCEECK